MEKEVKIKSASDAQKISEAAQQLNHSYMLDQIEHSAKSGYTECILFCKLNLDSVKNLMEMGFSVSEFYHPIEQRKVHRISW